MRFLCGPKPAKDLEQYEIREKVLIIANTCIEYKFHRVKVKSAGQTNFFIIIPKNNQKEMLLTKLAQNKAVCAAQIRWLI